MGSIEQYFPVVLFIVLNKKFLSFESVGENLKCNNSMKATKQHYVSVRLFIML